MKYTFNLFISLLLILSLQSCKDVFNSSKSTIELTDENSIVVSQRNNDIRIPKSPKRIVVFDLGALDIIDEMGLSDRVVGFPKKTVPDYLEGFAENDSIVNTGSLKEPNFKKVNETNPDLIIIGSRQENDFEELNKIAPTLFFDLDYKNYVKSISENITLLGNIFDLKREAHAINEDMLTSLKSKKVDNTSDKGLFVMYNNKKFSAYGRNSRFGFIHDDFKILPVSEKLDASTHGQSISSEYIQDHNPDILFVLDRNAAIGEGNIHKSSIENSLIKETNAYKNNRIIYLSPKVWYLAGGGVQSMKLMAEEVNQAF